MTRKSLDLDAIQAFVSIVDCGSFTAAAQRLETTQAAVSLRLKRLEEHLGVKLIHRTPRMVRLSFEGTEFLRHARDILSAQSRAYASVAERRRCLTVGISEHVAGPELPALVRNIGARSRRLLVELRIAPSSDLLRLFDSRELDTVIVRLDGGRGDGIVLFDEWFGWFASPAWRWASGTKLPIVTIAKQCGVRTLTERLLDASGHAWEASFVGGGIASVAAAVEAGIGVAALAPRFAPTDAVEVGAKLALPALPRLPVLLHTRARDADSLSALESLKSCLRGTPANYMAPNAPTRPGP